MKSFGKNFFKYNNRVFKNQGNKLAFSSNLALRQSLRNQTKSTNFTYLSLSALGLSLSTYFLSQYNKQDITLDGFYEVTIKADFQEGEKRAIQVGPKDGDKVLVVKKDGEYFCVSNACTHFGFGLDKGIMVDDKVTCPLHMAQFSVKTGEHEYGPVFKGLETFEITEKNGELHIKVDKEKLNKGRTLPMSKKTDKDNRKFVIVGGGVSGLSAAETLRQSGYEGEIVILSNENVAPYDRTMLSKNIGAQLSGIQVRSEDFLKEFDINLVKGANVDSIDKKNRVIRTQDGQTFQYEKLLIATGAKPRIPPIPNVDSKGVLAIRNYSDLEELRKYAGDAQNIVIAGAGFIGLESASSIKGFLKDKQVNITVCDVAETPLSRVLGPEIGKSVQGLHEQHGIQFQLKTGIKEIIRSEDGKVSSVVLSNGQKLDADLVILGTGVAPNTSFVNNTLPLAKDGGIETDIFQKVKNEDNIYAAGDVANYPWWYTGQNVRIEHYNEAIHQGYIAGLNMLGKTVPNDNVPFFWTRFHNKGLHYTGYASQYDDLYIDGDLNKQEFVAYYFQNSNLVAAAGMGKMNAIMIIQEAMKQNILPKADDLRSGRVTLNDLQEKIKAKGHKCGCRRRGNCGMNKK